MREGGKRQSSGLVEDSHLKSPTTNVSRPRGISPIKYETQKGESVTEVGEGPICRYAGSRQNQSRGEAKRSKKRKREECLSLGARRKDRKTLLNPRDCRAEEQE